MKPIARLSKTTKEFSTKKQDVTLQQWCKRQEELGVSARKEYWNMQVGLPYSTKKIGLLEKKSLLHANVFLKNWKKPETLYWEAVGSIAGSKTYKLSLKLDDLRRTVVSSKKHSFNGKPVTWTTWRQYAVTAADNERKEVFDTLITKSKIIAPIIHKRFDIIKKIYARHKMEPLDVYCKEHHMSLANLKAVIAELQEYAKPLLTKQWRTMSNKFLSRNPTYYDDMYFMRNTVFSHLNIPKKINPISEIRRVLTKQNFSLQAITVDAQNRPHKYPSPFCSFIKIPSDVRVSYKAEQIANDLNSVFHEFGHAAHATTISEDLPYWTRYSLSEGLSETFSTLYENILHDKRFLIEEVQLPEQTAEEFVHGLEFIKLYAIAFYCANSLFKIDYFEKQLTPDQCDANYAAHIKKCMGITVPGEYWKLHHILPEALLYVPSYLLAMIRAAELGQKLKNKYGSWWNSKEAGAEIRELMRPGADSCVGVFEKLNSEYLTCNFGSNK